MNRVIIRQELQTVVASRRGLLVIGVLMLACLYALGSGGAWKENRAATIEQFLEMLENVDEDVPA